MKNHFWILGALILVVFNVSICLAGSGSFSDGAHCLILEETDRIALGGEKFSFINIVFSKRVKLRVLDEVGAKELAAIPIPEMHDPYIPRQAPAINNISSQLLHVKVMKFKCTVNGVETENISIGHKEIFRVIDERFAFSDAFTYGIVGLVPGDEVVYEYEAIAPYQSNWEVFLGYRIFFNGRYPKLKYELKLTLPESLLHDLYAVNEAIYEKQMADKQVQYSVRLDSLAGCIGETNARPYRDLPHITFRPKPYEWLYLPYNQALAQFMPFHIAIARYRESRSFGVLRQFDIGSNNRDLNLARSFIDGLGAGKSKGGRFTEAHNQIANRFDFLDDKEYFAQYDTRLARVGEHMVSGKLRNISRYDAYWYLFAGLDLSYQTLYPCDVRYGLIGEHYLNSMRFNDMLFLVNLDSVQSFIYPKKSRIGYYVNELPFYFEGSSVLRTFLGNLIRTTTTVFSDQMTLLRLPTTPSARNVRRIEAQVTLGEVISQFKTSISLTGQFSTNARHVYKHQLLDSTINLLYGHHIGQLPTLKGDIGVEIGKEMITPPFLFSCKSSYAADIASSDGNLVHIDLSGLFPHITDQQKVVEPRFLPYYTDFMGTDIISYNIQLDGEHTVVETPTFTIDNLYGKFEFSVSMSSPDVLKITSMRMIGAEKVLAENIHEVMAIVDAIEAVNKAKITLKKG